MKAVVWVSLALGVLVVLGLMAYVRLAPVDAAAWHIALNPRPAAIAQPARDLVTSLGSSAFATLELPADQAGTALARINGLASAWPRTQVLAGSVAEGRITWVTRSALWGFPDFTTAEVVPEGLLIYARARYGSQDFGENAARLRAWVAP